MALWDYHKWGCTGAFHLCPWWSGRGPSGRWSPIVVVQLLKRVASLWRLPTAPLLWPASGRPLALVGLDLVVELNTFKHTIFLRKRYPFSIFLVVYKKSKRLILKADGEDAFLKSNHYRYKKKHWVLTVSKATYKEELRWVWEHL